MVGKVVSILAAAAALLAISLSAVPAAAGHSRAGAAPACADPDHYPAKRDASNPLHLPSAPGANPLNGAHFFVDGPAHGAAAGAIASLMGLNPKSFPDSYSWAQLQQRLQTGSLAAKLAGDPSLAGQVKDLEKIASEPETNRFSLYSGGGGPGAIYGQVHKILCDNMSADPGTVPIFTTYFLYQAGYCETRSEIRAHRRTFQRQVDETAKGIDRRPAVMLLELDAIGSSRCMVRKGSLGDWEADIRYEIDKLSALPHTVVYVEGGYADSNPPGYTARALNAVGIRKIRGFFTNDTHEDWTINEVRWAQKVSRLTHGAHFIVNTANNGRGPLVPPNRVKYGNELLCNPTGRGLGPQPTTDTRFAGADAFLWTAPPGNSSGSCAGKLGAIPGGPASGIFWPAYAIGEASRANGQLGPGYPSLPY